MSKDGYGKMYCYHCHKETRWEIEHRILPYYGISHVLVCEGCLQEVPEVALERYMETGKVVIPV